MAKRQLPAQLGPDQYRQLWSRPASSAGTAALMLGAGAAAPGRFPVALAKGPGKTLSTVLCVSWLQQHRFA